MSNWTEAVAALADGSEGMNLMCRFTSLSSFASGIAGVASKGLGASSKLASYPGATKADSLFSDTHSAAAASGIAMVDEGATFVYAQGLDLADQSANDELVEAANGAGRGILVHGVVGAQFLHSGHHMSDSALAVNQVSSTLQTIIPADSSAPTPDERALCVGVFYTQSKIVGTRGSILAALLTHQYMTRVGKLTLRLWGSREGSASAHLAYQVLNDLRALYPGAIALLSTIGITQDGFSRQIPEESRGMPDTEEHWWMSERHHGMGNLAVYRGSTSPRERHPRRQRSSSSGDDSHRRRRLHAMHFAEHP